MLSSPSLASKYCTVLFVFWKQILHVVMFPRGPIAIPPTVYRVCKVVCVACRLWVKSAPLEVVYNAAAARWAQQWACAPWAQAYAHVRDSTRARLRTHLEHIMGTHGHAVRTRARILPPHYLLMIHLRHIEHKLQEKMNRNHLRNIALNLFITFSVLI